MRGEGSKRSDGTCEHSTQRQVIGRPLNAFNIIGLAVQNPYRVSTHIHAINQPVVLADLNIMNIVNRPAKGPLPYNGTWQVVMHFQGAHRRDRFAVKISRECSGEVLLVLPGDHGTVALHASECIAPLIFCFLHSGSCVSHLMTEMALTDEILFGIGIFPFNGSRVSTGGQAL